MDDVITLIMEAVNGYDEYGNEIKTGAVPLMNETGEIIQTIQGEDILISSDNEREVFCQVYGITRREFYQAATADIHPELTVRLSEFEDYQGEKLARYRGVLYSVVRIYRDQGSTQHGRGLPSNAIELTLERKIGNG